MKFAPGMMRRISDEWRVASKDLTLERVSRYAIHAPHETRGLLSMQARSAAGQRRLILLLVTVLLSGCGGLPRTVSGPSGGIFGGEQDGAPSAPIDISAIPEPVPRAEPLAKYGNPASYVVYGKRYFTLASSAGYVERGVASWYGTKFHNRRTSSGEPYDLYAITAAHKTLPLPCYVLVTNLQNGRTLIVRVNDRGPFHENRIIDLSYAAAAKLGILATGTGLVEVRVIDPSAPPATQIAEANPDNGLAGFPQESTGESATELINDPTPAERTPSTTSVNVVKDTRAQQTISRTPNLYLQVGAFSNLSNAERLRTRLLKTIKENIKIVQSRADTGALYRVRLGPMTGIDAADRLSAAITGMGLDTPQVVID